MLAGAAAVLLSVSFEDPPDVTLVGRDAPINAGATNRRDIDANNSPTLVRNPVRRANLAVANRIDTPFFSCALHVSLDGGANWRRTPIPAPRGEEAKCFSPDVAFTADGTLHLSFVTLKGRGNVPNATWLSTSKDGGRTLSKPIKVTGPLAFQVRLAPDPKRPRRLYMTWLQGIEVAALKFTRTGNPIQAIRSDDGGATWTRPMRVSDGSRRRVIAPSPAVGPKGELYVLFLDVGEDRLDYAGGHNGKGGAPYDGNFKLVLTRSLDGGA
ncbi:MAG: sialidase family protein, partial [Pseudonocardiaceae bacterium]